jgi:hypothetical protein
MKVYHPKSWAAAYPSKPKYWLTVEACLADNPGLTKRDVTSTPYIGPVTPEFIRGLPEESKAPAPVLTPEVPFPALVAEPKPVLAPEAVAEEPKALTPAQKRTATLAAKKAAQATA